MDCGASRALKPVDQPGRTARLSTHLVTFQNSVLVTYSGGVSSFTTWWTHHKILATSNGSSTGTVEVRPHNLTNSGANFGVFLEP